MMKATVRYIAILLLLAVVCHFTGDQRVETLGEVNNVEQDETPVVEQNVHSENKEVERVIDPNKPMIALTFDDGPGKHTDKLLNLLEKYDVRATFFLTGTQVNHYPDEIRRMKELGCEIGNHTENHKQLTKLKKKGIKHEVDETDKKVKKIIGESTKLVRPPYGSINQLVKETVNRPLILWSIDTNDWKKKDAKKITKYIKNHVKDGDIVLLHDIHGFTVESMETVIPHLIKQGYQLVTVSEMAEARGVKLKAGKKYYNFKN